MFYFSQLTFSLVVDYFIILRTALFGFSVIHFQSLFIPMHFESVVVSNHFIFYLFIFSIFSTSGMRDFCNVKFFASGGRNSGISVSASVHAMNIQDWCFLGWFGWIFLQSKGLSRVFLNTTVQNHQFVRA